MKNILIAGAGKIGCILAILLADEPSAKITLIDQTIQHIPDSLRQHPRIEIHQCDVKNATMLFELIQQNTINAIVSCLPYFFNFTVAEVAKANACHYFDLTEDVDTTHDIFSLAKNASTAFVPQCGVAPGFINIVANHLIQQCDDIDSVKLYCGALPQKPDNALGYALTWSTDGLINEYGNLCRIIDNGQLIQVPGLSGCEKLDLEDQHFEVFCTSGGIGTLIETYKDKIKNMYYKSIRYPGHCEKMRFLLYDLKLNEDRNTLKHILEQALPTTTKDIVITHVSVHGSQNKNPVILTDTRQYFPTTLSNMTCTAIQAVTSSGAATVIDTVLSNPSQYHGAIKQEDFSLEVIQKSRYFDYLKQTSFRT